MQQDPQKQQQSQKKKPQLQTVILNQKTSKRVWEQEFETIFNKCNKVPLIPFQFNLEEEIKKIKEEQAEKEEEQKEKLEKNEYVDSEEENDDSFDFDEHIKIIQNFKGIVYIDKKEQLHEMISYITKKSKENQLYRVIGIDTEQSFQKSYVPYLSLIQISTLDADYVVDCLALGRDEVRNLKCIFENKSIVKTFFAGQTDMVWLKRDYQLQVYNYCDIQILGELAYGKRGDNSLVYLWENICEYSMTKEAKKNLQISEWSNRPLSQEQINYSALDAHYLIYLRYFLISELLIDYEIDFILEELYKMQQQVLKPYEERQFNEKQYLTFAYKMINSNTQIATAQFEKKELSKIFIIELARLRENIAKEGNLNLGTLCQDKDFINITQNLIFKENIQPELYEKNEKFIAKLKFYKDYQQQIQDLYKEVCIENKQNYLSKLNQGELKHDKKNKDKELKKEKLQKRAICKQSPYENCQLLAPSGLPLCNCNKKKIEWYLNNGLGEIVKQEPLTLKLNFQPSGKDNEMLQQEIDLEDGYYTTHRDNCCVVCGSKENFLKFHIVPPMYRTYFPNKFKSHRSHDILLFCFSCHQIISNKFDLKKQDISRAYNVPLQIISKEKKILKQLLHFIALCKNLEKHKEKMSNEQLSQTISKISQIYQQLSEDQFLQENIKFLQNKDFNLGENEEMVLNKNFQNFVFNVLENKYNELVEKQKQDTSNLKNQHGEKVISMLDTDEKLIDFIKIWRQFFIDTMNPKFLPSGWSVDHKFCRDFGTSSIFSEQIQDQQQQEEQKQDN